MIRCFLLALVACATLGSQSAYAVIYNWVDGVDRIKNPSTAGPWTYGSKASLSAPFVPMRKSVFTRRFDDLVFVQWIDEGPGANLEFNLRDNFAEDAYGGGRPADSLTIHPGAGGVYGVLRFTAPTAGNYTFNVSFTGNNSIVAPSTDVHVLVNGANSYSGAVNAIRVGEVLGAGPTFVPASPIPLAAGGTIDLAVGDGGNGHGFDLTGAYGYIERIGGAVSSVPEPACATLAGSALMAIGLLRRRSR
ncbi:hypothetical protein [Lacipirellula sp.]|uniref:hypothetical protein n=1 Tax=Lacipirellula sp. TaxID=2691419 RepID=UPI003D11F3E1